ncbi:MAG: BrnT family toxin [Cyclobacteriaceae bacterium]
MEFEFDSNKSASNLAKHGVSFEEARELWKDPDAIELQAKPMDEPRFLLIARIAKKHWSAITTIRAGKTRIISVRRSRKNEIAIYESERSR